MQIRPRSPWCDGRLRRTVFVGPMWLRVGLLVLASLAGSEGLVRMVASSPMLPALALDQPTPSRPQPLRCTAPALAAGWPLPPRSPRSRPLDGGAREGCEGVRTDGTRQRQPFAPLRRLALGRLGLSLRSRFRRLLLMLSVVVQLSFSGSAAIAAPAAVPTAVERTAARPTTPSPLSGGGGPVEMRSRAGGRAAPRQMRAMRAMRGRQGSREPPMGAVATPSRLVRNLATGVWETVQEARSHVSPAERDTMVRFLISVRVAPRSTLSPPTPPTHPPTRTHTSLEDDRLEYHQIPKPA